MTKKGTLKSRHVKRKVTAGHSVRKTVNTCDRPEISDPENIYRGISTRLQKRNYRKINMRAAFPAGVSGLLLVFTGFNLFSMLTSDNSNSGRQTPEEYAREFYIDRTNDQAFIALFTETPGKSAFP